jgi:glycosyltransferase involved in cell wall biosynthesis
MSKPKILMVHNFYQHAGGESNVFETELQGLRSNGHPVVIYNRKNEEIDKFTSVMKLNMFTSAYYSRQTEKEITGIIEKEKPEIAIVQNVFPLISPAVYIVLRRLGIPIVQAVYNYRFICPEAELYTAGSICERCIHGNFVHCVVHRCYRNSFASSAWYATILGMHHFLGTFKDKIDCFMVPDDFLGHKLIEGGFLNSKIQKNVNPYFVNPTQPVIKRSDYVLYIGRFTRAKGVLTLLSAMRFVKSNARLAFVGLGEVEGEMRDAIERYGLQGRVSLLGPRWGADAEDIMSQASALVIPSEWYDNLPQILCQANGLGKPVLASRIDGIPEYIQEGVNGFLFAPGDQVQLAASIDLITEMEEDEYRKLSVSSRKVAEQKFDYPAHYEVLNGIFDALLRRKSE